MSIYGVVSICTCSVDGHIHCWWLMILSDGQICKRDELKTIIKHVINYKKISANLRLYSAGGNVTYLCSAQDASFRVSRSKL